jgi:tRNA threonylcarbamoyladenosine biosynthesis protein TsaE
MINVLLEDIDKTEKLGKLISKIIGRGCLICLNGNLGAGKTTLTQIIARNLGVDEYVNSPSFSLMNTYNGKYTIHHYDLYKLNSVEDVLDIGIEDYLYTEDVVIIEWAEKIEEILPDERIDIELQFSKNIRKAVVSGKGTYYEKLKEEMTQIDNFRD